MSGVVDEAAFRRGRRRRPLYLWKPDVRAQTSACAALRTNSAACQRPRPVSGLTTLTSSCEPLRRTADRRPARTDSGRVAQRVTIGAGGMRLLAVAPRAGSDESPATAARGKRVCIADLRISDGPPHWRSRKSGSAEVATCRLLGLLVASIPQAERAPVVLPMPESPDRTGHQGWSALPPAACPMNWLTAHRIRRGCRGHAPRAMPVPQ
jgi:hypothetical protein